MFGRDSNWSVYMKITRFLRKLTECKSYGPAMAAFGDTHTPGESRWKIVSVARHHAGRPVSPSYFVMLKASARPTYINHAREGILTGVTASVADKHTPGESPLENRFGGMAPCSEARFSKLFRDAKRFCLYQAHKSC
ncbi:hypothetical protein CEXT_225271 [Caerostris extrusa]|uniref:Uncharacterized protein n=1 Tax=Caerostris extrusa TaxID=172846 RepID=A0AAV4NEE1_CAEEX|nr:hypothetical protein CEXT_225271 [Caerostris extrusa]